MDTGEEGLDANEGSAASWSHLLSQSHKKSLWLKHGNMLRLWQCSWETSTKCSAQDQLMLQPRWWSNKMAKMIDQRFMNHQRTTIASHFPHLLHHLRHDTQSTLEQQTAKESMKVTAWCFGLWNRRI